MPPVDDNDTLGTQEDSPVYDDDYKEIASDDEPLGSDSDEEVSSVQDDEEEGEQEETDSSKDSKEDDSDEEAEDQKPQIPFDRPTVRELKSEYPDLFKKFPTLRDSYFREIEFTKIFPTVEDAREAFETSESFETLSDAVLTGNPVPLLESIEKADKKALEVFSLSFLPALYKRDQTLYSTVITPLFQNLVRQVYRSGDENTRNAALVISDFLFGDDGGPVAEGKKSLAKSTEPTEEQRKLAQERDNRIAGQFREAYGKVEGDIVKGITAIILKDFDPEKAFTPFLRKQAAAEILKRVNDQLSADEGHKRIMGARWKKAKSNGYSDDERSKIVSTYLARAKSLIPRIREKVRAEMLGSSKKESDRRIKRGAPVERRENLSGRTVSKNGHTKTPVDYRKMSDLDILNSD